MYGGQWNRGVVWGAWMDYRTYRLGRMETIKYGLAAFGITAMVALCFYNSPLVMLFFPLVAFWYLREKKEELAKARRSALKLQFKEAVQAMSAALTAGYSAENALREAQKDLMLYFPDDADMIQELAAMQRKLDTNLTIEEAVRDFADRSGIEEAETFSEIFAVGKRSGGDLIAIMKDTAGTISQTVETERQVESVLASKKYEQKIMNVIPFGMVLYLRIGCPGFMDPVYGNLTGIAAMTACLGVYLLARYMGRRMLEIEV